MAQIEIAEQGNITSHFGDMPLKLRIIFKLLVLQGQSKFITVICLGL